MHRQKDHVTGSEVLLWPEMIESPKHRSKREALLNAGRLVYTEKKRDSGIITMRSYFKSEFIFFQKYWLGFCVCHYGSSYSHLKKINSNFNISCMHHTVFSCTHICRQGARLFQLVGKSFKSHNYLSIK